MSLPKVAITFGDPAGIGPEIIYKSLQKREIYRICRPVIIGSFEAAHRLGFDFTKLPCEFLETASEAAASSVTGKVSAASGEASYRYILKASEMALKGEVDAIATAPISKEALQAAGHDYPGHTELLAKLTKTKDYAMLMVAENLRAVMVTRHVPLMEVGKELSTENIFKTGMLVGKFLKGRNGIKKPRVGVLALNPHAGENGILGDEERKIIAHAVKKLVKHGIDASGPLPADSAWLKCKNGGFDLLVAMYHDQVMIGLKILSHESLVNVTVGLPFIRTSPGHGTAFDIAGKNRADPSPMAESIKFAANSRPRR